MLTPDKSELKSTDNTLSLETLFNYHLKENHFPSGYAVAAGQLALVSIAAAGLLYAKPAADFAEHENLGIEKNAQIYLNIISTCYAACIVLCAATIFFYRAHVKPQQVPIELKNIIVPPFTAEEYFRKNIILGGAAALSAIPFVTIAYMAYQTFSPFVFYPLLAYIFLANTLLHFLPIKLILDDPLYGSIPRYFKKQLLSFFGQRAMLMKEPLDVATQAQVDALRSAADSHLAKIMNNLSAASSLIQAIENYSLEQFISAGNFPLPPGVQLTPCEASTARLVGVGLVISSCSGYLANPYLVFNQIIGLPWWASILLTAPPTFFLGVLFTYFGDTMGQQIWMDIKTDARYVYACFARDPTNPAIFLQSPIFKLYPVAASVCMALNVALTVFSAAAAMEMMRFAFEKSVSPAEMLTLYIFAQIGVGIVGLYAPLSYQKMLLTYYALYLDQGPRHNVVRFQQRIEALQGDLYRFNPEQAAESTGDVEENMNLLEQKPSEEQAATTSFATWCFWRGSNSAEMRDPLLPSKNFVISNG